MKNLPALFWASRSFLFTFFGRQDPTAKTDPAGLTQLQGWEYIPESKIYDLATKKIPIQPARYLLYCYAGPHVGECFFIRNPRTSVGHSANSNLVLTPPGVTSVGEFEFILDKDLKLKGMSGLHFELNGKQENQSTLVDYDEVQLFGNHFLVLSINGEIK
jgi:hypothetical protein